MSEDFKLIEDKPGQSAQGISQQMETNFFNSAAADHAHRMRRLEMGAFGRILGSVAQAPMAISFFMIAFLAIGAIATLIAGALSKDSESWIKAFEHCLEFFGLVLGYIFGKGSKSG